MEKIIKQLVVIGVAGAMTLAIGCGVKTKLKNWMDEQADEFKDDITALAPTSIDGKTAHWNITLGTGDFPTAGTSITTYSAPRFENTFTGTDDVTEFSGTYIYTKTASNQATIAYVVDSDTYTVSLYFTSPTSGTYTLVKDSSTQTGTFVLMN